MLTYMIHDFCNGDKLNSTPVGKFGILQCDPRQGISLAVFEDINAVCEFVCACVCGSQGRETKQDHKVAYYPRVNKTEYQSFK